MQVTIHSFEGGLQKAAEEGKRQFKMSAAGMAHDGTLDCARSTAQGNW